MELQFQKSELSCLQQVKHQVQNLEQTLEVRLDDTMPEIGRVIGAWGQVLLRGKEWRGGSVQVSGGVMTWVLYVPEGGGACRSVEAWVPFQCKMDIPPTQHDGTLWVSALLRSVDGRSLSAKKLMVRVNVGLLVQALVPGQVQLCKPETVPEDVQLREKTYPVRIPMEAGEKPFYVEETLSFPGTCQPPERLLRYSLHPELIDKRVMADKVVFRGTGLLHVLYLGTDGQLHCWDFELPFSQYAELEGSYEEDAAARILPAVTSLELEMTEEAALQLKAGLIGQYVIYERPLVQIVEDAYSTKRELTMQKEQLQMPVVLDMDTQSVPCELSLPAEAVQVIDTVFLPDQAGQMWQQDGVSLDLSGQFQVLYSDKEGSPAVAAGQWNGQWQMIADDGCRMEPVVMISGVPQASSNGQQTTARADMLLDTVCTQPQGLTAVTALELLEAENEETERPSIILRRTGQEDLWQIAKDTGSTVDAIKKANGLTDEPADNTLLLIPIA